MGIFLGQQVIDLGAACVLVEAASFLGDILHELSERAQCLAGRGTDVTQASRGQI